MAVPTKRRPPPRIVTASAMKVQPRGKSSEIKERQTLAWQKKAFLFCKIIPELNYASRFYAKMLSKLRIYPALRDEKDELTPITEGLPVELLDRIQDPGGGRSQILSAYGRLMFIIGEGYLFGRDLNKDTERWSFVNPDELIFDKGKIIWKPTTTSEGTSYPTSQAEAYRLWTPDPERSGEAESPMRAIIEIAEELDILTKAVRATAVSRMSNGILKVPAELSFGSSEAGVDDDPEENPFLADIIDHIIGIIENAGSPEAGGPFLAEGALEYLAGLEWIKTHDPQTDYLEQGLRKEAIDRAAMGMDLPPEILKGMSQANHWGARQILHDTWRSHGSVVAESFCDDVADAYLRPALREAKFEDWRKVVIAYDDSNVVVPPDRTDDADKAHDRITISDEAHRKLKGIAESMRPDEEETRIRLALKLKNTALLKGTKYEIEESPAPAPGAVPPGPAPSTDAPPNVQEGPPEPGPAGTSRKESRNAIVHGAAELALLRCREVAGARIRSFHTKAQNGPILLLMDGQSNAQVAAIIGQGHVEDMGLSALTLVKGGTDGFCQLVQSWGFDPSQSDVLAEMLRVYSAKTLFTPGIPPLPSGFIAQVERLREMAEEIDEATVRHNNDSLARLSEILPGSTIRS